MSQSAQATDPSVAAGDGAALSAKNVANEVAATSSTQSKSEASGGAVSVDVQSAPDSTVNMATTPGAEQSAAAVAAAEAAHPKDLEYAAPSRVVFVRNLPLDVDEAELLAMAKPYGGARAVLLLQRKGQAFVELKDTHLAAAMKRGMDESPVELRGWKAMCAFSKRDRITPPPKVDVSKALAAAAGGPSATSVAGSTGTVPRVSRVLLVTIMNVVYPVTVDILQQVMAAFGDIEKVVVFVRDPNVAALVQMPSLEAAIKAKENLDGQCIYTNCNKMRIQFSKLDGVSVRYNNDKSRDFLNPGLPQGPTEMPEGDASMDPYATYSDTMLAYEGSVSMSSTSPTHSVSTAGGGSPLARAGRHPSQPGAILPQQGEGTVPHGFTPSELPPLDTRHAAAGAALPYPAGTSASDSGTPPSLPPGLHLSPMHGSLPPGSPMMSPGRAAALAAAYAIGVTPPVTGMAGPGRHGSFSFPHGGGGGDSSTSSGSPTARQGAQAGGALYGSGNPPSPTFRGMTGASRTTATGQSIPHSPRRRVPEAAVVDSSGAHVGYRYRSGSSEFVAFGAPPHAPPSSAGPQVLAQEGTGVSVPPSALASGGAGGPSDELRPLPGDVEGGPPRTRGQRTDSTMSELDLPPSAADSDRPAGHNEAVPSSTAPPLLPHGGGVSSSAPIAHPSMPPASQTGAPHMDIHAAAAAAAALGAMGGGASAPGGGMEEGSPRHRAAMAAAAAAAQAVYSGYYPGSHAPMQPHAAPYDPYGGGYGAHVPPPNTMHPPPHAGGYSPYGYGAPPPMGHIQQHGYGGGMYGAPPPATAPGAYNFYGHGAMGGAPPHMPPPSHPSPSPVLIVSGFNAAVIVAPEQLFVLASAFGTVERIKIMFKRRDTALIQYASLQQAQIAQVHMHRCPLFGMQLKANFSSHHVVHLPQAGTPGAELTQDFTGSPGHRRFQADPTRGYAVEPPSDMLQISGPLAELGEGGLRAAMEPLHPLLIAMPTESAPPNSPALVRFRDVNDAATCLVMLHGRQVRAGGAPLTIWFFNGHFPEMSSTSTSGVATREGTASAVSPPHGSKTPPPSSAAGPSLPPGVFNPFASAGVAMGAGYSAPAPHATTAGQQAYSHVSLGQ